MESPMYEPWGGRRARYTVIRIAAAATLPELLPLSACCVPGARVG